MKSTALCCALLLVIAPLQAAQPERPEAALTEPELAAHLRFLASDELAGRLPGTAGHSAAARYLAEQFRAAGVEPAAEGDYFQPVPLQLEELPETAVLELLGLEPAHGEDFLVLSGGELDLSVTYTFRGDGLSEGAGGAGGRVIVALGGRPSLSGSLRRRRLAAEAGAVALVELYEERMWNFLLPYLRRARLRLDEPDEATVPHLLMRIPDEEFVQRLKAEPEGSVRLQSSGIRHRPVQAANVAGLIPGRDPGLKEEFVVLTAHYDHLGSDPEQPGATPEDPVFNGARDNAMGVTAVLAAAKALAAEPPARSVLLLAVTAEEGGLLGSRYYSEHPLVPLERTVFNLNSDGGGWSDTDLVTVLGLDRTTVGPRIASATRSFELEAFRGPEEAQDFFDRSDNLNFARRGVPAVTFSAGLRTLEGPAMQHYHRPSDEAGEDFDYAYLLAFCRAFAAAARAVADAPERPRWVEGDPYAEAARQLYGQPREKSK